MSKRKATIKALESIVVLRDGNRVSSVDDMFKNDKIEFNKTVCSNASLRMSDYFNNDKSGWDGFINATYK